MERELDEKGKAERRSSQLTETDHLMTRTTGNRCQLSPKDKQDNLDEMTNMDKPRGNGCQPYCPLEALHDQVILTKYKGPTEGGLHLPDNAGEDRKMSERVQPIKAIVMAVGPGRFPDNYQVVYDENTQITEVARFPMLPKPGDIVWIPDLVGIEVKISGVNYYIVSEGDILCRFRPEAKLPEKS